MRRNFPNNANLFANFNLITLAVDEQKYRFSRMLWQLEVTRAQQIQIVLYIPQRVKLRALLRLRAIFLISNVVGHFQFQSYARCVRKRPMCVLATMHTHIHSQLARPVGHQRGRERWGGRVGTSPGTINTCHASHTYARSSIFPHSRGVRAHVADRDEYVGKVRASARGKADSPYI